jgi:hypothetical protein
LPPGDVVELLGLDGQVSGRHDGGPWLFVGEDDGGGAEEVGSLVGALDVGADEVVCRVVGDGGGGVYGA